MLFNRWGLFYRTIVQIYKQLELHYLLPVDMLGWLDYTANISDLNILGLGYQRRSCGLIPNKEESEPKEIEARNR